MKKSSEYKFSDREIKEMVRQEFHIDLPIRNCIEERREYIKQEINSESINNNAISKARVRYLSKMI